MLRTRRTRGPSKAVRLTCPFGEKRMGTVISFRRPSSLSRHGPQSLTVWVKSSPAVQHFGPSKGDLSQAEFSEVFSRPGRVGYTPVGPQNQTSSSGKQRLFAVLQNSYSLYRFVLSTLERPWSTESLSTCTISQGKKGPIPKGFRHARLEMLSLTPGGTR